MTFELNEVEARQEEYPSTLSYLKLLNVLIAQESHSSDKGSRYIGIFRFVRDQVFAPHTQRAYADPVEKWELVAAALRHFQMMLSLYQLTEDDIRSSADHLLPPENSLPGGLATAGFDEWESDFPKHYEYLNVGREHCDGATDKPAVWPSFGGCYFSMPSDPS
jgi:hypothetical protein